MRPRSLALLAGVLLTGALAAAPAAPASAADGTGGTGDKGFTIKDPRIAESSGLAASHLHPGIYWTHNDSGDGPYIYAVDSATGKTVARITLSGVGTPRDVEAISIGPDNQIYVGDIGDNLDGSWPYVWIYRLPEPKQLVDQTVRATQYVVKYSNGARNAESLIVHPKTGRVYIIDKKEDGGHLYEGPATLSPTGTNIFKPVATVDLWATDAAFSPDGTQLAVRGYFGGIYYDWNGGKIKREGRLDVPLQKQGESITYSTDGTKLLYGSEGSDSPVQAEDVPGGSGKASPSGGSGSAAGGDGGSSPSSSAKIGAVAVGVAVLALFGLRRLRRPSARRH
ncbi:WD40 repeat domain-containing protein [Streptomyces sp. NPDC048281]|uniref:WD40 repeat domain-containing protein n=1 Tax=Streptomyces sp. NPDC048281 TaxID=3154715 RepID=UPI00344910BA